MSDKDVCVHGTPTSQECAKCIAAWKFYDPHWTPPTITPHDLFMAAALVSGLRTGFKLLRSGDDIAKQAKELADEMMKVRP